MPRFCSTPPCWIDRDDDATVFSPCHVIAQGLCDCVEGQYSAGKALHEL